VPYDDIRAELKSMMDVSSFSTLLGIVFKLLQPCYNFEHLLASDFAKQLTSQFICCISRIHRGTMDPLLQSSFDWHGIHQERMMLPLALVGAMGPE
jgi:hypothetical protein